MILLALLLAAQITVCPRCELSTIQSAITQAKAGDTINVQAGTYKEGSIIIDKPLRLVGHDLPVIDGEHKADSVLIKAADAVEISGFEIKNSGKSYLQEFAGIKVEDSENCALRNNIIKDNNYGIYLANSNFCEISANQISGIPTTESDTGDGIHLWQGHGHRITDNTLSGQRDGIYFEFVSDSLVSNNVACNNLRYGLHFMFSHRDKYVANKFCRNESGVAVMYSQGIEMIGNQFEHSEGAASYGLLLKEMKEARIESNQFFANSTAVFMEGTNRSNFYKNEFANNGWGLRIFGDCENNIFSENNFRANTFDVSTNSNNNPNTFLNNYWSQYDGYDLDRDGKGDKPFRLVSLSSVIFEKIDSSFVLLRSPILGILDQIERALPELIPGRMQDQSPAMQVFASEASHD